MATYKQIQNYVRERHGYTPKTCWIAHAKELNGLPIKPAPNRNQEEDRAYPCPLSYQADITAALEHFGMLVKQH